MPLKESYVVWNNKGGTGKTTIVFHLATQYARKNPDTRVIVLDMCPQANVSTALLTERNKKDDGRSGEEILQVVTSKMICEKYEQTVCGFFKAKLVRADLDYEWFLTKACKYNTCISDNVSVLCGDRFLETLSKRIDQERRNDPVDDDEIPWKRVTLFLNDFVHLICKNNPTTNHMFFIDTNPTFSVYTELAIAAGSRLIVPINADTFSKAAVESLFFHVYGIDITKSLDKRYLLYKKLEFYWKVQQEETKIDVPKIHLFINNRSTPYDTRAAAAFAYKADEVAILVNDLYLEKPLIFTNPPCIETLGDFHTKAVLSLHTGTPLEDTKGKFKLGAKSVTPTARSTNDYVSLLDQIVEKL